MRAPRTTSSIHGDVAQTVTDLQQLLGQDRQGLTACQYILAVALRPSQVTKRSTERGQLSSGLAAI